MKGPAVVLVKKLLKLSSFACLHIRRMLLIVDFAKGAAIGSRSLPLHVRQNCDFEKWWLGIVLHWGVYIQTSMKLRFTGTDRNLLLGGILHIFSFAHLEIPPC